MVDVALRNGVGEASETALRSNALCRLRIGDALFRSVTRAASIAVLVVLAGVIVALVAGALPALQTFGLGFLFEERWNPVTERFGALAPIYGTVVTS